MGEDHDGLHHEVALDNVGSGFNFGHQGLIDLECSIYSHSVKKLCGETYRHLHPGVCGTTWGAGFSCFRYICSVHLQILEEIS